MSDARRAVTCGACRKRIPFWLGGPIALSCCPWCNAYLPEVLAGAAVDGDPRALVRAPSGIESWYVPGDQLARRWRVVDALHYGGTCAILRALPREGHAPALLVLLRVESPEAALAVRQATDKLGSLEDEAILRLREHDADGSTPLLVYDLPEGKLLASVAAADLAAQPEVAQAIFERLVAALARMQAARVACTDLAPWLVAVKPKGEPLLLGAGLGHRLAGMLPLAGPSAASEEAWLAPELLAGQLPTPATDVYGALQLWSTMRIGGPASRHDLKGLEAGVGPLARLAPFERNMLRGGLEPRPERRIPTPQALLGMMRAGLVPAEYLTPLAPVDPFAPPPRRPAVTEAAPEPAAPDQAARDRSQWNDPGNPRGRVDQGVHQQEVVLEALDRRSRVRAVVQRALGATAAAAALLVLATAWASWRPKSLQRYPSCAVALVQVLPGNSGLYRAAIDGASLILIPEGKTTFGVSLEEAAVIRRTYEPGGVAVVEREAPERELEVPRFLIDRCEVSNARYKQFLDAITPTGDHGRCHPNEPRGITHVPRVPARWATAYSWTDTSFPTGMADRPVVLVSWFDAYAYAAWAGLRLPTELEWERAARGNDRRHFPWGNSWEPERCNVADRLAQRPLATWADWKAWVDGWKKQDESERNYGTLTPVGAYPQGASPFGVLDMAGNVWEWARDDYVDGQRPGEGWRARDRVKTDTLKAVRGGSWCNFRSDLRVSRRGGFNAGSAESYIGFRCARDAP